MVVEHRWLESFADKTSHFIRHFNYPIGIFMNQFMSKKKMTIFGDETQTQAFSYIQLEDHRSSCRDNS